MIYEKRKRARCDLVVLIGICAIALVCVFCYLISMALSVDGFWQVKFVDIINILAQLATAAAFFLGVNQYVKQSEKDRNSIFCSECNSIIAQMVSESQKLSTLPTTYLVVNAFIDRMGHLGSDLNVLFQEIPEDASKAIVRMRWQSMYYGCFRPAMNDLDLKAYAISLGGEEEVLSVLISDEENECEKKSIGGFLRKYTVCKSVLSTLENGGIVDLKSILSDTTSFSHYFMSNKNLKDYMYGTFNIILGESSAPLIYAAMSVCERTTFDG